MPARTRSRSSWLLCCTALLVLVWPAGAWAAPSPAPFPTGGGVVMTWVCETTPATAADMLATPPTAATPERQDCAAQTYGTVTAGPVSPSGEPGCTPTVPCVTTWDQASTQVLAGGFTLTLLLLAALVVAQLRSR